MSGRSGCWGEDKKRRK